MSGKQKLRIICRVLALCIFGSVFMLYFGIGPVRAAEEVQRADWNESVVGRPDALAPQTLSELQNSLPSEVAELPRYDSRNYGIVPPVKDQGGSNICWCYAGITASEISIHRTGIDPDVSINNLRLSPELLAQVRHQRGADPLNNTKGENTNQNWYSSPGNTSYTPALFAQWWAPAPVGGNAATAYENCAYRLESALHLYSGSVTASVLRERIKKAIAAYGAVTGSYNNVRETYFYNPKNETGTGSYPHACTIIGWDDTIPAEKFIPGGATQNGGWLVKNSYDSLPYFWLSYDCGISDSTWAFSYVPKNMYDYNYFYDASTEDFGMSYSMNVTSGANVFEAKKGSENGTEWLKAVNVAFLGDNATCQVKVYTDLTDASQPDSGTLSAEKTTGILERPGYYTVHLDQPVALTKGSFFAVVATVSNEKNTARFRLSLDKGKSYRMSNYGTWGSLNQTLRIKAYTKADSGTQINPPVAEAPPAVGIDYSEETLTNFNPEGVYFINGEEYVMAGKSTLPILPEWMGEILSIVKKGSGAAANSEPQPLAVPGRPDVLSGLRGESGENNGKIAGLAPNGEYQILQGETSEWTDKTANDNGEITGLAYGAYKVRIKAGKGSFAGEAAAVIIHRPARLMAEAPVFHPVIYGEECEAKVISLSNQGDGDIIIEKMSFTGEGADYFTFNQTGSCIVPANGENTGYTICPRINADVGMYRADLVITYDGGKQTTIQVRFTVSAAPQNAPAPPCEKEKTKNSIILERIENNANGAKAQYSKDGGNTWQDSPVFLELTPNTRYSFAARYYGTKNHMLSPASGLTEITTAKEDLLEEKDPSEEKNPSADIGFPGTAVKEELENKRKINDVIHQIIQIGEVDGSEISKQKIDRARNAYESLTEEQKGQIPKNIETILLQAEEKFIITAIYEDRHCYYKVINVKGKEAEVIRAKNPKSRKIRIPDQVKINGVCYRVTSVAKYAFSNNKKAVLATIGKNIKKIGKEAFRNCKKLEKITIKSRHLAKIGKNAFCGIAKSAQIKVPRKKYNIYKKMLAKKEQRGTVKIRF